MHLARHAGLDEEVVEEAGDVGLDEGTLLGGDGEESGERAALLGVADAMERGEAR